MPDKPIIFSAPMVRALLAGRKTQTRRVLGKTGGKVNIFNPEIGWSDSYVMDPGNAEWRARYTPYAPGDRLYVREAFSYEALDVDRNSGKGPIPDVEMMFCWLAAQDVRATWAKIKEASK